MNAVNVIFGSLSYFVVKSVFVDGIRVFVRKCQSPCDDVAEAATLCLCIAQPPLNPEFHIWFGLVFTARTCSACHGVRELDLSFLTIYAVK